MFYLTTALCPRKIYARYVGLGFLRERLEDLCSRFGSAWETLEDLRSVRGFGREAPQDLRSIRGFGVPDFPNRVAMRWGQRCFSFELNQKLAFRARLHEGVSDSAPPVSKFFFSAFSKSEKSAAGGRP